MAWWEWVAEIAGRIGEAIETGLRGIIAELPEEIRPSLPAKASLEQIEEAMAAAPYAERFIQEVELDQAYRLARGVPFYEKLTNVARLRHWTVADPYETPPPEGAYWSERIVLVAPDGVMTHVDVRGKSGEMLDHDEVLRAAASALDDDFVNRYEGVGRSQMIREWIVAAETYVERFKPLG